MKKKFLGMAAVTALTLAMLTGCGSNSRETTDSSTKQESEVKDTSNTSNTGEDNKTEKNDTENNITDLSGTITMVGSTSMEKFANALGEAFMNANPSVTVNTEFVGSSAGIEALLAGTADIGNASRALEDSEKENGAIENIVAIDGIAVITDPSNKVENLTKDQLKQIYTGEVKNWSELGGDSMPIVVVGREAGSGTRGAFEELLEIADVCKYAQEIDSTGAVLAKVASTPGAIGYISVDIIDDTVITLKLNGVEPTTENIKAGSYELSRPFVMATKGAISEQKEEVQKYFEFIDSEEGQKVIEKVGLISTKQ